MKLFQKILNQFNGLHYPLEYLCVSLESFEQPLHAYLFDNGRVIKDITKLHSFVGYHPLILAFASKDTNKEKIDIIFSNQALQPNEIFSQKDAIAFLRLQKIKEVVFQNDTINFYEGIRGSHRFISAFHQAVIGLNNRLYNKKQGNVFLHAGLYKQVQIAYSLPRVISLITVGNDAGYNLFPTDLHGAVNEGCYIDSLRHTGKACQQVLQNREILLTEVNSSFYKSAYLLGKNHMQELKPKENFPFNGSVSPNFHLPVPLSALRYRELELDDSFIHGIHRLLIFKTISSQQVENNPSTLAHVHNVYATWRYNHGLPGNYLLR